MAVMLPHRLDPSLAAIMAAVGAADGIAIAILGMETTGSVRWHRPGQQRGDISTMRTAPSPPLERALPRMARISADEFRMASDDLYREERAAHRVAVDSFWIDTRPVTVADFSRFVAAGYRAVAGRPLATTDDPGAAAPCCTPRDPLVPEPGRHPVSGTPRKIIKVGSHLCAPSYCQHCLLVAPRGEAIDTSTAHMGFRCLVRPGPLLGWPGVGPAP